MARYDYRQAVKNDVKQYIKDRLDREEIKDLEYNMNRRQDLYDEIFVSDDVTGNASGSYFCNAYKAEECLCHNLDLLADATEEFGGVDALREGAEACDVTIRCYMLARVFDEAVDELTEELADIECPECGHVFEQGEYWFNEDTGQTVY